MATFSEERISHLAHLAVDEIRRVTRVRNERLALNEAKQALAAVFNVGDRLDEVVRRKIPPRVAPGTAEWEILYRRYMEEELRKSR